MHSSIYRVVRGIEMGWYIPSFDGMVIGWGGMELEFLSHHQLPSFEDIFVH